jgi:hypothetical protein
MKLHDICYNHHGGNSESMAAFESTPESERAAMRERVFRFILARGEYGATADEIAVAFASFHNTVAPRLSELKQEGRIVPSKETRPTRLGRQARVQKAVGI